MTQRILYVRSLGSNKTQRPKSIDCYQKQNQKNIHRKKRKFSAQRNSLKNVVEEGNMH